MTAFIPGSAAQPTSEVELTISCRGLEGKDVLSKSDPMCVTYIQQFGDSRWVEYHRTETITNSHDPDFASKVLLSYRFEEQQPLKFELYDVDSESPRLEDHDFLGFVTCNLGQIISSGKVKLQLLQKGFDRVNASQKSYILIAAEELATLKDEVYLQFSGYNLDKKDWFGKSDPFLEIYKSTESGDYSLVHKTEVLKCTLNPKWQRFSLPVRTLCNGDYHRNLKFFCYDWNASGSHSLIGEFYTTLQHLSQGPSSATRFKCIHPEKKAKKNYSGSGEIALDFYQIRKIHSFMDYVRGGTQLHCTIAIDFTGSNGNPTQPSSLHYVCDGFANCYEQAISSVVSIIQDYDSDKMFPVLGFGARLPPHGVVSHEFYVNMESSPFCEGVNGVLQAYKNCIRQVQLYGPTNFSPVINHVARFAAQHSDGSSYFILLILTDGVITDMPQTIDAIVRASGLPMSIIIVGVGNADFSAMETLDADTVGLKSNGVKAVRDIVQFVPFNKYINSGDPRTARIRLAKEVLAEIPTQFVSFMKANKIEPKPPLSTISVLPPDPEQLNVAH